MVEIKLHSLLFYSLKSLGIFFIAGSPKSIFLSAAAVSTDDNVDKPVFFLKLSFFTIFGARSFVSQMSFALH